MEYFSKCSSILCVIAHYSSSLFFLYNICEDYFYHKIFLSKSNKLSIKSGVESWRVLVFWKNYSQVIKCRKRLTFIHLESFQNIQFIFRLRNKYTIIYLIILNTKKEMQTTKVFKVIYMLCLQTQNHIEIIFSYD